MSLLHFLMFGNHNACGLLICPHRGLRCLDVLLQARLSLFASNVDFVVLDAHNAIATGVIVVVDDHSACAKFCYHRSVTGKELHQSGG